MGRQLARRALREARLFREEPAHRARYRAALIRPYRVRQFRSFGRWSVVHRPTWIYGAHHVEIGERVWVLTGAWLAAERCGWDQPEPLLSIGDGCGFRAWCTFSASERIVIERDVTVGAGCSIVDCDHIVGRPNRNALFNPVETAPIRIGEGSWLGDRVSVLRGSTIGRFCVIGAGSVVRGEIPDWSVAVGAPARVVGSNRPLERDEGAGRAV